MTHWVIDSILTTIFKDDDSTVDSDTSECSDIEFSDGYKAETKEDGPKCELDRKDSMDYWKVRALNTALKMYLLADKFEVLGLRLLAKKRFMHSFGCCWKSLDNLNDIADDILTSTAADDPLRSFVCNVFLHPYTVDENLRSSLRPVIEKHHDFAIRMPKAVVCHYGKTASADIPPETKCSEAYDQA